MKKPSIERIENGFLVHEETVIGKKTHCFSEDTTEDALADALCHIAGMFDYDVEKVVFERRIDRK